MSPCGYPVSTMQPARLPLPGGCGIEGPVGFGLYNVKAYAVRQGPALNRRSVRNQVPRAQTACFAMQRSSFFSPTIISQTTRRLRLHKPDCEQFLISLNELNVRIQEQLPLASLDWQWVQAAKAAGIQLF